MTRAVDERHLTLDPEAVVARRSEAGEGVVLAGAARRVAHGAGAGLILALVDLGNGIT